jgi:DNA-directed RNA polymerase subunit RPC12/RpoP
MKYDKNLEPIIDLWSRVIKRAIDDLVLFSTHASETEKEVFDSAHSFIFNDEHTIFLDNYWVSYSCERCEKHSHEWMSSFSMEYKCQYCGAPVKGEDVYISELMQYLNKDCPVVDLFAMLGLEDIEGMRDQVRHIVKSKTGKEI